MKIHIKQIPPEGLHIEGEEDRDILELNDPSISPLRPVRYRLHVGLSNGGLFAVGELESDLELECVTCLKRFEYRIRVPNFATQVELTGAELVDLTESVREDILLALPPYPHCDWNGENACAGLRKLEVERKSAIDEEIEMAKNPWLMLDKLTKLKD